jgi:hypothetical protein
MLCSGFVSGPDFRACGKTHFSKGNGLQYLREKPSVLVLYQARLYRQWKDSCFVSGHDFSRAVNGLRGLGFSPCYGASGTKYMSEDNSEHYTDFFRHDKYQHGTTIIPI